MKRHFPIFAIVPIVSLVSATAALAQSEGGRFYHGPGMMWGGGMGGFGMFLGMVFSLLIIAALIFGAVWAVRHLSLSQNSAGNDGLDILRNRYARGEIDTKEFEERRRLLSE